MSPPPTPPWLDALAALEAAGDLDALELGPLWHLRDRAALARQKAGAAAPTPELAPRFEALASRQREVQQAVERAVAKLRDRFRSKELSPRAFREHWQSLGYAPNPDGQGTAADDLLDGAIGLSRATDYPLPSFGTMLNVPTPAAQLADFLAIAEPTASDVIFDIGSGSGKFAVCAAASCEAQVCGIELYPAYVAAAQKAAGALGLDNARFIEADVRTCDLSKGTHFYLYHPFYGDIAREVAQLLGQLARQRPITIYSVGPTALFGDFLLAEEKAGALKLVHMRGEGRTLVLRSAA